MNTSWDASPPLGKIHIPCRNATCRGTRFSTAEGCSSPCYKALDVPRWSVVKNGLFSKCLEQSGAQKMHFHEYHIWMFPKRVFFFPQIIHLFIGFSIIFTIHFGIPLFLQRPIYTWFFLKCPSLHILQSHQFPVAHVTLKFSKISNLNTRKTTDHLGRAKGPLPFPEVRCYISPRYEVRRFPRTISVVDRKGRYDLKFRYYRSTSRNNEKKKKKKNNNNNNNNIFSKAMLPLPRRSFCCNWNASAWILEDTNHPMWWIHTGPCINESKFFAVSMVDRFETNNWNLKMSLTGKW